MSGTFFFNLPTTNYSVKNNNYIKIPSIRVKYKCTTLKTGRSMGIKYKIFKSPRMVNFKLKNKSFIQSIWLKYPSYQNQQPPPQFSAQSKFIYSFFSVNIYFCATFSFVLYGVSLGNKRGMCTFYKLLFSTYYIHILKFEPKRQQTFFFIFFVLGCESLCPPLNYILLQKKPTNIHTKKTIP